MKFTPLRKIITFSGVLLITAASSQAGILAAWDASGVDMDGNPSSGQQPIGLDNLPDGPTGTSAKRFLFVAPTQAAGVDQASMRLSSALGQSRIVRRTSPGEWGFSVASFNPRDTLAGAIDRGHFFEFTISADNSLADVNLDIDSLELQLQRDPLDQFGNQGAQNAAIFSSLDGFGTALATADLSNVDTNLFPDPILLGSEFDAVPSVTFRVYAWNTQVSANGSKKGRGLFFQGAGDDLVINGTVIPEFSAAMPLSGLLGLSLFGFRRRKQQD